ncbi:MAG: twin-arginine translocase TatA/TatE family subunit [Candidatus Rokubacteria bacterium]|nr:twin-arginine translocase TatA/TatE family subunit [Candidatus Rokubacteria bacterium]
MFGVLGLFGPFGTQELLIILVIVMLLFGASKIPELARSLGMAAHHCFLYYLILYCISLMNNDYKM